MVNRQLLGIDCGGTKVLAQSASFDSETGLVSPGEFHLEVNYSDSPNWNPNFIPIHLDLQRQEFSERNIFLTEPEMDQGDVIVETIQNVIFKSESDSIGLCFPGIKNDRGVVIMANGPRIPDLLERIPEIDSLYNDSDCCVVGEWKSTIGKMKNAKNSVYIGGGTGIADGIILNGELINFNERDDVKRSWELIMENGQSVESCLSPKGMIDQWNFSNKDKVITLDQLSKNENSKLIFNKAIIAFSYLIQNRIQFFRSNNSIIEKIVLGQRLGMFMADSKLRSMVEAETDIPIDYSTDRRTAALGAAWTKVCS
jgi:predicted NBD/HSP70 family sugar kinase